MSKPARILILEDDVLIAGDISRSVSQMGHQPIGPFYTEEDARNAIRTDRPDMAILDFGLSAKRTSIATAQSLDEMDVPFCFVSGYERDDVLGGSRFRDRPFLSKPFMPSALEAAINDLAGHASAAKDSEPL